MTTKINYLLIIIGGIITLYANSDAQQNEYLIIGGIVILLIGLYRLARAIPSKTEIEDSSDDILNND